MNSAKTVEAHMPSTPRSLGSRSTAPSSNTMVRRKEISADTGPSFSAVKKLELNTAMPVNKYAIEKIRKAWTVSAKSFPLP